MSMLSSQVEELRNAAMTYRMLGKHTLANVLLEAAESITELRGALLVASVDYRHLSEGNDKLRELVRDMWRDGMCECDERGACAECEYGYLDRMRDLGIEVDE